METSSPIKAFSFAAIASMTAEIITLPFDVAKTRLQVQGKGKKQYNSFINAIVRIARNEGIAALFNGYQPALLRQMTYGSARYGLYNPIKQLMCGPLISSNAMPLYKKVIAGSLSGAIASALFTPIDLIKVRMQCAGMYHLKTTNIGIVTMFKDIISKDGVLGLWRGVVPTVARATVLASAELSTYDEVRYQFVHNNIFNEGIGLHVATALVAGFVSTLFSSPFDVIKSRMMNSHHGSFLSCMYSSIKNEGISCLWNGFTANYLRVGPRVLIIFVIMERLKLIFDS